MASRPQFAWIDGRVLPFAEASVPLDDRGLHFGESLYEVAPITAGRPRLLPEHVARMQRAATELGVQGGVPDVREWEQLVAELIRREGARDAILYAQVTGGAAPREHVPDVPPRPTFFAYVTPLAYPTDADVVAGIRAITLPDIRWSRRDLKTTMLLPAVLAKREARRRGANEALLVGPDGLVHEGASSNVFALLGSTLVTPAQSSSLLPGTMRPLVCDVAREAGLVVESGPLTIDRVRAADEVFVTSTTQLAMPVVVLDDAPIGPVGPDGPRGGPTARELARRLRARLELSG